MKEIARGAESVIYESDGVIIKDRIKKNYRIRQIDEALRKKRTDKEARILRRAKRVCLVPLVLKVDDKTMRIEMQLIEGNILKDVFETLSLDKFKKVCEAIALSVAKLHNEGIIHGDLTTSNMILNNSDLFFIDFGLADSSEKIEDKAVDLHLLHQAIESKHHKVLEKAWKIILKTYESKAIKSREILTRLGTVELRGRYKKRSN